MSEIQELEVLINDMTGVKPIRLILTLAQCVRGVVLKFPFKPIQLFPTFLIFEHLILLNINIPHATIAPFLQRHPHLKSLQLGACGHANTQICPFTHYSLQFPHLIELICPSSCMQVLIACSIVNRLFTTYDGVKHLYFPMYKLLNFCQIETFATLTNLLINFDHATLHLLQWISVAAPSLCVLKLVESQFSHTVRYVILSIT